MQVEVLPRKPPGRGRSHYYCIFASSPFIYARLAGPHQRVPRPQAEFRKDRVIAFAGVARASQHLGHLTYLAGLWKEWFPVALLWCVGEKPAVVARAHNNLPSGSFTPLYGGDQRTCSPACTDVVLVLGTDIRVSPAQLPR
jgi:hypothetical protein